MTSAVLTLFALLSVAGTAQGPPQQAVDLLTAARKAMGGASQLAAVKTLRIRGSQKGVVNNLREHRVTASDPMPLEYRLALPDRFYYSHSGPRGLTPPTDGGFVGNKTLIAGADIRGARRFMGLIVVPVLLNIDSAFRLTLVAASGNTLRFEDPDGSPLLIDLDSATSLPKRIHWIDRDYKDGTESSRVRDIGDYRKVGSLLLPHRLTAADDAVRDLGIGLFFNSIEINPQLTDADFRRK